LWVIKIKTYEPKATQWRNIERNKEEQMNIKISTDTEIHSLIEKYPYIKNVMCYGDNTDTLFAVDDNGQTIAFLSAFYREIPAPLNGEKECYINVIDIIDSTFRRKGIGSALVQEIIKIAKNKGVMQIRAYCEIHNISSNKLWLKNGFCISPVKHSDGSIPGSYVTYRIL